jgi:hypothetical protein
MGLDGSLARYYVGVYFILYGFSGLVDDCLEAIDQSLILDFVHLLEFFFDSRH